MNKGQKAKVAKAIETGQRAIKTLELESASRDVGREIESYRAELEMLQNEEFMDGMYESLAAVQRGERGMRLDEIERQRSRARRVSS